MKDLLSFSRGNAKLPKTTWIFSLPAGHTCPGACECLAKFDRNEGRLKDGPKQRFRCYAASMEAAFTSLRVRVDNNLQLLRDANTFARMRDLMLRSLPDEGPPMLRIHAHGDYFSRDYLRAWAAVACERPDIHFYGYTKSLHFWVSERGNLPDNMVLNASYGGRFDHLIDEHVLPNALVVFHPDDAAALNLKIDHDDSLAASPDVHAFALLLHGVQPVGSDAAEARKRLKREGHQAEYGRGNRPK